MDEAHHETVYFTGRVQGVGFRYSTLEIAREFEVSGFVKNLADGRVQLEVEGKSSEVSSFIAAIEQRMHGYLRKLERSAQARPAQFSGFTIR